MDNVTHTLVGVTLAHATTQTRFGRKFVPEGVNPRAVLWTSVIASNLPDLDFLVRFIPDPNPKLLYLLHHRGPTHTFIAVPLMALLCAWIGTWWAKLPLRGGGWRALLPLAGLAALLHIAADFWNDYGVHPLSPFSNRWYYGDFIFIIEPLLWLSMLPLAFDQARTRLGRVGSAAFGALIVGLAWTARTFVPWPVAVLITLYALVFAFLQRRIGGVGPALFGIALTLSGFAVSSTLARSEVSRRFAAEVPEERLVDFSLSPLPSNPFCWRVISASAEPASGANEPYIARIGAMSLWPSAVAAERCGFALGAERTAPMRPLSGFINGPSLYWIGEFRGNVAELRELASRNCLIDAHLGFLRDPFWMVSQDFVVLGDLRYDREEGVGFSEAAVPRDVGPEACSRILPRWDKPLFRNW